MIGVALAALFVWVVGAIYFWMVIRMFRQRTDAVAFVLWPVWQKTVTVEEGGGWHWFLRITHWLNIAVQLVIGVPITLFLMGVTAKELLQGLAQ